MPAYQSVPDFSLTEKYHMKQLGVSSRPNTPTTDPPNRNGGSSRRSGIRWRIKPPSCQTKLHLPISRGSQAAEPIF
jgi:hypothetical protein